ncbi:MAG: hypothetical protein AAF702_51680 [Chloroflexota bacterium]
MGRKSQHRFHGGPERFEVVAEFVADTFGNSIRYIADVAGGQGMLSRILNKKFNYESEVIDPREHGLTGVSRRVSEYDAAMASYYDLVVGLHPDEATRPVAESSLVRPVLIFPCCNFWSSTKLGRDELVEAIEAYYDQHQIVSQRVTLPFKGPKNIGILSWPQKD